MIKQKKTSKFNVTTDLSRRTYNDILFDSEVEMQYYKDVLLPAKADGTVLDFEIQKQYILQPAFRKNGTIVRAITHIVDFYIQYADGTEKIIDIKGMVDPVAAIKRKIFWYLFPTITYEWLCYSKIDGGWIIYEDLKKARTARKRAKNKK